MEEASGLDPDSCGFESRRTDRVAACPLDIGATSRIAATGEVSLRLRSSVGSSPVPLAAPENALADQHLLNPTDLKVEGSNPSTSWGRIAQW